MRKHVSFKIILYFVMYGHASMIDYNYSTIILFETDNDRITSLHIVTCHISENVYFQSHNDWKLMMSDITIHLLPYCCLDVCSSSASVCSICPAPAVHIVYIINK